MATKEVKVCDVFGTQHDVQPVLVTVKVGAEAAVALEVVDMGPRARARLDRFLHRGVTKPNVKVAQDNS